MGTQVGPGGGGRMEGWAGVGTGPGAPEFPEDKEGAQARVHFAEEKLEARGRGGGGEGQDRLWKEVFARRHQISLGLGRVGAGRGVF